MSTGQTAGTPPVAFPWGGQVQAKTNAEVHGARLYGAGPVCSVAEGVGRFTLTREP